MIYYPKGGCIISEYDALSIVWHECKTLEEAIEMLKVLELNMDLDSSYWVLRGCVMEHFCYEEYHSKYSGAQEDMKTYLMYDSNTGLTKIGKSKKPNVREKTLQSEKPSITLLKVCDDSVEGELHKRYDEKRVRGEWFNLSADEIKDIVSKYNFKDAR